MEKTTSSPCNEYIVLPWMIFHSMKVDIRKKSRGVIHALSGMSFNESIGTDRF